METLETSVPEEAQGFTTTESTEDLKATAFALVTDMLERQGLGPEDAEVNVLGNEVLVTLSEKTPYPKVMEIGRTVQDRMNEHELPHSLVFEDHAMGEHGARYLIPKQATQGSPEQE